MDISSISELSIIYTLCIQWRHIILSVIPCQYGIEKFGHLHIANIKKLPQAISNMRVTNQKPAPHCEPCLMGKMKRAPIHTLAKRSSKVFERVYCDLNVTISEPTDINYVLGITDDYTGFLAVYFLESKTQTAEFFKKFMADYAPYGTKDLKIVRADHGSEFLSHYFQQFLVDKCIKFEASAPYNPHQNARIERAWGTIFNMGRSILIDSKVPREYWTYTVSYACYLINRSFSESLQMTPVEALTKRKPDANDIKLFGALCYGYNHHQKYKRKFDPRASPACFIGFDHISKSKLLLYPEDDFHIRKVLRVHFTDSLYYEVKHSLPLANDVGQGHREATADVPAQHNPDLDTKLAAADSHSPPAADGHSPSDLVLTPEMNGSNRLPHTGNSPPRTSKRQRKPTEFYGVIPEDSDDEEQFICGSTSKRQKLDNHINTLSDVNGTNFYTDSYDITNCEHIHNINSTHNMIDVPSTYNEAIYSNEQKMWRDAMQTEYNSLIINNTFNLSKLPPGEKLIGGRWVFAIKTDPTGQLKYKARYVAKGFCQRAGVNYTDTYAPTAKLSTLRVILEFAVQRGMPIHQFDVISAYLNSKLDVPIYIRQPPGFEQNPALVCKLNKAIYGLKQSGFLWNQTLNSFMFSNGLIQSLKDPCLFVRSKPGDSLICLIWVDDVVVAASNLEIINQFRCNFNKAFSIKDLGPIKWFLGIQFSQSHDLITMNQSLYINTILSRFDMENCKPRLLPSALDIKKTFQKESPVYKDPTKYRELIGSLIYLMTGTRPDICHITALLSRFMSNPKDIHMNSALEVLRYLRGQSG